MTFALNRPGQPVTIKTGMTMNNAHPAVGTLRPKHDMYGETTPIWMIAKNCGVREVEITELLRSRRVEILADNDAKPAVRKADMLTLIAGE